jgi:hypothetical protein
MSYSVIQVLDYTPYALVLCACATLIALSWLLRGGRGARIVVPRWMVAASIGFAAGLGLGLGGMHALAYHWVAYKVTPFTNAQVAVGAVPPELAAGGWLNGEAPDLGRFAGRVVVVDLWADW